MFEVQRFVSDCQLALKEDFPPKAVREVVERAVSDPGTVLKALGEPGRAGMQVLHRSDNLTILNVIWAPWMTLLPHNHRMWAVIGIYTGREDNIFWRRIPGNKGGEVEAAGAKALREKDAVPLGSDVIHSVTLFRDSRGRFIFTAETSSGCRAANGTPRRFWSRAAAERRWRVALRKLTRFCARVEGPVSQRR